MKSSIIPYLSDMAQMLFFTATVDMAIWLFMYNQNPIIRLRAYIRPYYPAHCYRGNNQVTDSRKQKEKSKKEAVEWMLPLLLSMV
jgi:hypothetical protein